jgi:hypothetical protein
MSYFQDFASGYQMTSGARERKRDRQDRADQEALRKQFELDRDMERYAQENAGRQSGQEFTARENEKGRTFTGSEAEKGRTFTGAEAEKGRTFTGAESAADRALRKDLQNQQLDQAARQFATTNDREYQNMGLMAGFKSREDARQADPASMANQLANEKLIDLRRRNSEADAPLGAPGAPKAPTAPAAPKSGLKSGPKPITSQAEHNALEKGERFIWNGRTGVKN